MSRLFHRSESGWACAPLAGGRELLLFGENGHSVRDVEPADVVEARAAASVVRFATSGGSKVDVLVASGSAGRLRVNGLPLAAGLRVLGDKDAIGLGGRRVFYSAVEPAAVEPFPADDFAEAVFCPRCNGELAGGGSAVRCPGCGTWFHQDGQRDCYTYASQCPVCRGATTLGADDWTPEEL